MPLPVVQVLRRRNFRGFWLANLFAATGNQAKTFGIAWIALEISNSQLWVGLSLGAMALPIVVLSLLSGAIVDRLPRRRIILLSYLVLSVILFLAVYLIVSDSLYLWHLPMISLGAGAVFAFMRPAKEVFIVESVKRNQILTANSLKALSDDVGEIVAPSLAGLMIIRFGAESPFALAGIGFLCATGFILTTRPRTHLNDSGAKNSLVKEISEGVRYAISNRLVLALLIIAATAVFGTAVIPLLPVYGRDVLGAGPSGYGLLAASLAAGFLAGSILMTALGDLKRKALWFFVTAAIWDICAVAFGFSRILPLSVMILFIMGVGGSMFVTLLITLIQQQTANEMRGRVLSLYQIAFSAMPVGFIVGGALAQSVSNEFALIFGALMGTPVILILFIRMPSLRSL